MARIFGMSVVRSIVASVILSALLGSTAGAGDGPVSAWRGVRPRPVSAVPSRHTMHSYYLLDPESPDGSRVLFYASRDPAGHVGDVVVQDRATGAETVLAAGVETEDAHRVAMQQWLAGGRLVAFHEVVDRRWQVVVVDTKTLERKVVSRDRQLGFGRGGGDLLPMYGCHWNPGPYRDLYVWDARTGQVTTPARIADIEAAHGDWLRREFSGRTPSIAFPVLSPDLHRVFVKIAAGNGGDEFRAAGISHRQGTVFLELSTGRITWLREKWGHPAWFPDSRHVIEMGNVVFDADGGRATTIPNVPALRGMHPSVSPGGDLWVSDGLADRVGGREHEYAVLVADITGDAHAILDRFDNTHGARSWRVSHPHPVFSGDGRRIYYNASDGEFTRLLVVERP